MIEKYKGEGNHIESVEKCDEEQSTSKSIQIQNQELDLNLHNWYETFCHLLYTNIILMYYKLAIEKNKCILNFEVSN